MFCKCYLICFVLLPPLWVHSLPDPINLEYSVPEEIWNDGGIGDLSQYIRKNNGNQSTVTQLKILRGEQKDLFQISGYRLQLKQALNRESICQTNSNPCETTLDIAILSNFQLITILKLKIIVLDINDNAPLFPVKDVSVDVPGESVIGSKYTLPHATDGDIGQNSLQGYQLREKSNTPLNLFFLDTSDRILGYIIPKLVLNSAMNREFTTSELKYDLIAFDGGTPLKSGSIDITVNILETNKHGPVFERPLYNATCLENTGIDAHILTVKAIDLDSGENGRLSYSFQGGSDLFSADGILKIDKSKGIVSLQSTLDYEVKKEYHYTIMVRDHASQPMSATTELTLFVNDINDSPPVIKIVGISHSKRELLEINENSPSGTFVALISVEDQDTGNNGKVSCHLQSEKFELKVLFENEYQLVTAGNLDYETEYNYNVTIICVDKGQPPIETSQKVRILIKDLNDNAPKFRQMIYTASLRENLTNSVTVANIRATDKDSGLNGQINYLLDDRVTRWLAINISSGHIYTVSPLDHEVMNELIFTVIATDLGNPPLQSTTTFNLSIIDINDEAPHFYEDKYTFGTYENQARGTEIGSVFAVDPDTPPFDDFIYYIINDTFDAKSFSVNKLTGTIRTRKVLDREMRPSYFFRIGAKNTKTPFMSSAVSVTVYVVDKNDNDPVILFPSSTNNTAHLPISAKRGQTFSKINATDADYSRNALLTYTILNGNEDELFQLNEFDGFLSVGKNVRSLQSYNKSKWTLSILVKDNGKEPRAATANLNIILDRTINVPLTSDYDLQNGNKTLTKNAGLSHVNIILILGCIAAALVISLVIIMLIVKRKQRKHCKKEGIEYEIESKEELETLHSSCNIYDALPFISPAEEAEHRKSRIDSVLGRGRLNGVSDSPGSNCSLEGIPLKSGEDDSVCSNESGSQTPEIYGVEDLKPMEASTTDMQLYKLIKWLKEVQKNEKRMSENVPEISLPGSSVRGSSLEADATLSPQESESGIFQKQAYLKTISPTNTFGRTVSSNSPSNSKYFSLPYHTNNREKSPDFLAIAQSVVDNESESDDSSEEKVKTVQPHCGISCKSTPRYINSCKKAKDSGVILSVPCDCTDNVKPEEQESTLKTPELDKSGSYSPNITSDKTDFLDNSDKNDINSPDDNCNEHSQSVQDSDIKDSEDVFEDHQCESSPKKNNNSNINCNNYITLGSFKPDKSLKKKSANDYTDVNMNDLNVGQMKTIV